MCAIFVRILFLSRVFSFKCMISGWLDNIWHLRLLPWQQMSWWVVVFTIPSLSLQVCLISACANCSISRIHLQGLLQAVMEAHGHLIQPRLHWLIDKLFWMFKMAALVYKFLHSDYPSLFGSLLSIHCGTYYTRYDHSRGKRLISQYYPAVPK